MKNEDLEAAYGELLRLVNTGYCHSNEFTGRKNRSLKKKSKQESGFSKSSNRMEGQGEMFLPKNCTSRKGLGQSGDKLNWPALSATNRGNLCHMDPRTCAITLDLLSVEYKA